MKCPKCNSDKTVVVEIRQGESVTTRTYGCNKCTAKFMTVERILLHREGGQKGERMCDLSQEYR